MKCIQIILTAACLTFSGIAPLAHAETDGGAVIETMEGKVDHIDAETGQIVVSDFVYTVPRTVPVRRGDSTYLGLEHLRVGEQVILHMPPNQQWVLPMPVAEIEVVRQR